MKIQWITKDDSLGAVTIYENNIRLSKKAADYFLDAYAIAIGIDKDSHKIVIKNVNKEEAESFGVDKSKLYKINIKPSYGRITGKKMIDELKTRDKVILFVDEIHMLIGATDSSSLDFANIFKEGLGRGSIKVIGATTSDEYERYILKDKAFTRRFQKVEVPEPTREETIQIMMGTLPKFEKQTGRRMKYTPFIQERIMSFLVDITSEYTE